MPSKKHSLEEIIGKLREAEVVLAHGATTAEACRRIAVSEQTYDRWRKRRLCRVLGQHRSTQRKAPHGADDEAALTEDIIVLARQYGRYGYRRVTALLRDAGWHVNRKRVERI